MSNIMTDNEIIKALKYCEDCSANLNFEIADLINHYMEENEKWREQFLYLDVECERLELEEENNRKEIEKLQEEIDLLHSDYTYKLVKKKAKAEAIREFAERLKAKTYPFPCAIGVEHAVTIRAINELVEEMVGDNNDKTE